MVLLRRPCLAMLLFCVVLPSAAAETLRFSGMVAEEGTGLPLAGAEVRLLELILGLSERELASTTTDANGHYTVEWNGAPPLHVVLRAAHDGHLPSLLDLGSVADGPTEREVDFVLYRAGSAQATVTVVDDATQQPIEGVRVVFRLGDQQRYEAATGDSGIARIQLGGLGAYRACTRFIDAYFGECFDDHTGGGYDPILVGEGDHIELEFQLARKPVLSGKMLDHDTGLPLAHTSFRLMLHGEVPNNDVFPFTDADGSWSVPVDPGEYMVSARGAGNFHIEEVLWPGIPCPPPDACPVESGTPVRPGLDDTYDVGGLVFLLRPQTTIVAQVMESPSGKPLEGVEVEAGLLWVFPPGFAGIRSAVTGPDGVATITHAPADTELYLRTRNLAGYANQELGPLTVPWLGVAGGFRFDLVRGNAMGGAVLSAITARPLPARLWLYAADGSWMTIIDLPGGDYLSPALEPGTYFAGVQYEGAESLCQIYDGRACGPVFDPRGEGTPIVVPADGDVLDIDFHLMDALIHRSGFEQHPGVRRPQG